MKPKEPNIRFLFVVRTSALRSLTINSRTIRAAHYSSLFFVIITIVTQIVTVNTHYNNVNISVYTVQYFHLLGGASFN